MLRILFLAAAWTAVASRAPPPPPPPSTSALVQVVGRWCRNVTEVERTEALAELMKAGAIVELTYEFQRVGRGFAAVCADAAAVAAVEAHAAICGAAVDGEETFAFNEPPSYSWGLDALQPPIDLRPYDPGYDGRGVGIYVLDAGVFLDHEAFSDEKREAKMIFGSGYGLHGTHCAGIAAGVGVGVAPGANLYSVQVISSGGGGSLSRILAGLDAIADHAATTGAPSVVSISIFGLCGASCPRHLFTRAVDDLVEDFDIVAVVSAGNEAENGGACRQTPGASTKALTVGATDREGARWILSNYGACVDISAPGSRIDSASTRARDAYTALSGTSMATPLVAGVAALHRQRAPAASAAEIIRRVRAEAATNGNIARVPNFNGVRPTRLPTPAPAPKPPTPKPTVLPDPNYAPTAKPTGRNPPTANPTAKPTANPTAKPTATKNPTPRPTFVTRNPTTPPTRAPSHAPSLRPSNPRSALPTPFNGEYRPTPRPTAYRPTAVGQGGQNGSIEYSPTTYQPTGQTTGSDDGPTDGAPDGL